MLFKICSQDRLLLFPPSLEELISPTVPVLVVNSLVDRLNLKEVEKRYKKTGCSFYHPRMMLKVIICSCLPNTCSSRCIEDFAANGVRLSGMNRPDRNTVKIFRSSKLHGTRKEICAQIVRTVVEEDLVSLERVYTDGTEIESAAGRYTFVCGKSVSKKSPG